MAAALAPHKQTLHDMMAHSTSTGTLAAPVTDPAFVAHGPLTVATVDMQGGGCLVQTGDGSTGTQLDHLVRYVPEPESL